MILSWLRRRLRERGRKIFRLWDGQQIRRVDPIQAWRSYVGDPEFDLENDTKAMEAPVLQLAAEAWGKCVAATQRALGVKGLDEGGLTEEETVEAFQNFCQYVYDLKKNSSSWPTSAAPTVPVSSPNSSATDTKACADSISISAARNSAGPAA
jgi:hypothetical protein